MNKIYKKGGTVHPSPQTKSDDHLLPLLPVAIFSLAAVLTPEDREVLVYLISTASYSGDRNPNSRLKKSQNDTHSPLFHCDCFSCYTSYWIRWDSSPSRQLIHEIIDAFEDSLETKKITGKKIRRRRPGKSARLANSTFNVSEIPSRPGEPIAISCPCSTSSELIDDGGGCNGGLESAEEFRTGDGGEEAEEEKTKRITRKKNRRRRPPKSVRLASSSFRTDDLKIPSRLGESIATSCLSELIDNADGCNGGLESAEEFRTGEGGEEAEEEAEEKTKNISRKKNRRRRPPNSARLASSSFRTDDSKIPSQFGESIATSCSSELIDDGGGCKGGLELTEEFRSGDDGEEADEEEKTKKITRKKNRRRRPPKSVRLASSSFRTDESKIPSQLGELIATSCSSELIDDGCGCNGGLESAEDFRTGDGGEETEEEKTKRIAPKKNRRRRPPKSVRLASSSFRTDDLKIPSRLGESIATSCSSELIDDGGGCNGGLESAEDLRTGDGGEEAKKHRTGDGCEEAEEEEKTKKITGKKNRRRRPGKSARLANSTYRTNDSGIRSRLGESIATSCSSSTELIDNGGGCNVVLELAEEFRAVDGGEEAEEEENGP